MLSTKHLSRLGLGLSKTNCTLLSRYAFMGMHQQLDQSGQGVDGSVNYLFDADLVWGDEFPEVEQISTKGRNSRRPKLSNHGARPCSSFMRKLKKQGWYHKLKGD